jgi:nucleotide-binding universal stress UspA family protein
MNHRILVAVDFSENSFRAVDYVAAMAAPHPLVEITIHHVIVEPSPDLYPDIAERVQRVETEREKSVALFEEMGRRLTAAGLAEERIRFQVESAEVGESVSTILLERLQSGGFATVVVGRRGVSKREEFLFGSVSSKIVREAKNHAVWVIE